MLRVFGLPHVEIHFLIQMVCFGAVHCFSCVIRIFGLHARFNRWKNVAHATIRIKYTNGRHILDAKSFIFTRKILRINLYDTSLNFVDYTFTFF